MKKVIVITGPTASGKTDLSVFLAKRFKGEIINADSVQMYKQYNIGAAKISKDEQEGIKHHLLDIVIPGDDYTIYHFQKHCRNIIENINVPFLVGGSGLYIKSALFNYELLSRNNINFNKNYNIDDVDFMIQQIQQKDPTLVFDKFNFRRVLNAYLDLNSTKLRSQKIYKNTPLYKILTFFLDIDRTILKQRVILRLEKMLTRGLIQETKEILQKYPQLDLNIIGYREINLFLQKKINLNEAKNLIISKTMRYAKRQKTWFKNQMHIQVINALDQQLKQKTVFMIEKFLRE